MNGEHSASKMPKMRLPTSSLKRLVCLLPEEIVVFACLLEQVLIKVLRRLLCLQVMADGGWLRHVPEEGFLQRRDSGPGNGVGQAVAPDPPDSPEPYDHDKNASAEVKVSPVRDPSSPSQQSKRPRRADSPENSMTGEIPLAGKRRRATPPSSGRSHSAPSALDYLSSTSLVDSNHPRRTARLILTTRRGSNPWADRSLVGGLQGPDVQGGRRPLAPASVFPGLQVCGQQREENASTC